MKKGLLFVAVVAASLASCKKDHTCTCTTTLNGVADPTPNVTVYTESSKSAARANCVSGKMVDGADTYVQTCELK